MFRTDHKETVATVTVPARRTPLITRRSVFNYKRADFDGLHRSLSLIPWGLLDGIGVDEAVDTFYSLQTPPSPTRSPRWSSGAGCHRGSTVHCALLFARKKRHTVACAEIRCLRPEPSLWIGEGNLQQYLVIDTSSTCAG